MKNDLENLVIEQAKLKVKDLSTWKKVRWEGGRLYYESNIIIREIYDYPLHLRILYLETILNSHFIIQDNWPHKAPDITFDFKSWVSQIILKYKIQLNNLNEELLISSIENSSLVALEIDDSLKSILQSRIQEICNCFKVEAHLSIIVMAGSTIEGLLLGYANKYPRIFNSSRCAPKSKEVDRVKPFAEWSLSSFIDVSYDIGILSEDVKKLSHIVRDFRNYIHPIEQLKSGFFPDKYTANILFEILRACVDQLEKNKEKLKN